MNPAIVVIAYSRPEALERLLRSLFAAEYHQKAKLIVSIEGGATKEVVDVSRKFECKDLDVEIIEREEKLGLRAHVIACADLSEEYGSVIILEDDLIVDRYFYLYASAALDFYEKDHSISGIALYSYEYNELGNLPFRPMANGYDTYPMQIACSWGQCWTGNQWKAFKDWYKDKADLEKIDRLPQAIKDWPESSWKKYFQGFMIEQEKYFIYPYQSYSTNCSDAGGEHIRNGSFFHQVVMATQARPAPIFNFAPSENREVVYDSFMEPIGDFVWRSLGRNKNEVEIDLQGLKPIKLLKRKDWVVTCREIEPAECMYSHNFRPAELNLNYAVKDQTTAAWFLASSRNIHQNNKYTGTLGWLSYHAKMNLKSKIFISLILIKLPKLFLLKLARSVRRL